MQSQDDRWLEETIQRVLEQRGYASVGVQAENGVVILTGGLRSARDKVLAIQAVFEIAEVQAIESELRLRNSVTPELEEEIWLALLQEGLDAGLDEVIVENGVARVSGRVADEQSRTKILSTVRGVPGVDAVTSALMVDAARPIPSEPPPKAPEPQPAAVELEPETEPPPAPEPAPPVERAEPSPEPAADPELASEPPKAPEPTPAAVELEPETEPPPRPEPAPPVEQAEPSPEPPADPELASEPRPRAPEPPPAAAELEPETEPTQVPEPTPPIAHAEPPPEPVTPSESEPPSRPAHPEAEPRPPRAEPEPDLPDAPEPDLKPEPPSPPARAEEDIARDVAQRILASDYTVFDHLQFGIERGVVSLDGFVTSSDKKESLETAIANVSGVTSVQSGVRVLSDSSADERLRETLFRRIYEEPSFSEYVDLSNPPVHIIVDGKHVTLTGVVDTLIQQMTAEAIVRTTFGVRSVKNQIRVRE